MSPQIDLDALALASERFSPADIEFAARKASQQALERAVQASQRVPEDEALTTGDYLQAIEGTRATVTEPVVKDFLEDIERYATLAGSTNGKIKARVRRREVPAVVLLLLRPESWC